MAKRQPQERWGQMAKRQLQEWHALSKWTCLAGAGGAAEAHSRRASLQSGWSRVGGGRWGAARGQHGTRSRPFCSHSSPALPQCLGLRGCFPASFLMGGPPGLTAHSVLRILAFPSSHRRNFGLQPERNGETSNGSLQGERGSALGRESRCRLGVENGPEEA